CRAKFSLVAILRLESCTLLWIRAVSLISLRGLDSCLPDEINAQPATRPTITAIDTTMIIVDRRSSISVPADHHIANLQRGRGNGAEKRDVITDHFDILEHLTQIAGNCNLLDRMNKFSVLDPQPNGTTRIVARNGVYAEPDKLNDVQTFPNRSDNF